MAEFVEPQVFLVGYPKMDLHQMASYLREVGGEEQLRRWAEDGLASDAENLSEAAGRLCYRSWAPGLNHNVTRIREDKESYFTNVLAAAHGSVLEHATFNFIFHNVSRVLTHELVRHRAGTAVSQESFRFVRLTEMPVSLPEWMLADEAYMERAKALVEAAEAFQEYSAEYWHLDDPQMPFTEKKEITSALRRFAFEGTATGLMWSCNIRALRHVVEVRTAPGAEQEIRLVFGKVGRLLKDRIPYLFDDFTFDDGSWAPRYRKVLWTTETFYSTWYSPAAGCAWLITTAGLARLPPLAC